MGKLPKGLMTAMMLPLILGQSGMDGMDKMMGMGEYDELYGIDLKSEYALIKAKKSDLSARKRSLVVYRYEIQLKEEQDANHKSDGNESKEPESPTSGN